MEGPLRKQFNSFHVPAMAQGTLCVFSNLFPNDLIFSSVCFVLSLGLLAWLQVNQKVQLKVNEALCAKMEEILPGKLAQQVRELSLSSIRKDGRVAAYSSIASKLR